MKREVYESLGSRTTFIRCQKQEHPISPEEQTAIARVFTKYELGEPQYDRFEDVYNW